MTINHVFLRVSASNFAATRAFYTRALAPLGYKEMFQVSSTYVGIGSDYPYLWLKALPEGQKSMPTHVAFDAPSNKSVDDFYSLGLHAGGTDNGKPHMNLEMSAQPYYSGFVFDPDGNNVEAVSFSGKWNGLP